MKIVFIVSAILWLSACASIGTQAACNQADFRIPSYFAQGEKLAAFKVSGTAYGRHMNGLLQIKKHDPQTYEVSLFALLGGIKLMQATVTEKGAEFSFIFKQADSAAVRAKAQRLLKLLLFPPKGPASCALQQATMRVHYQEDGGVFYEYVTGQPWPQSVVLPKTVGSARVSLGEYAEHGTENLPHRLIYQDGVLEADMSLLVLKK